MKPAVWNGDPECGHDVADAYQTHYCSYIRVPRLLTLQNPRVPDELLLVTAHQWYELWFKVLLADLRAAVVEDGTTYEPVKLLRRGIELFRLLDQHADLVETVIVRGLRLTCPVHAPAGPQVSDQLSQVARTSRRLARLGRRPIPGVAEAVREYTARLRAFHARYRKFTKATFTPPPQPLPRRELLRRGRGQGRGSTYAEWLRLSELLDLQQGVKSAWTEAGQPPTAFWRPEHIGPDENLFIIVHQCFEIYFQVVLDLIDCAIPALLQGDIAGATQRLRWVVLIQRLLVQQIQMPSTMLPLDFMRFREQRMERDGKMLRTGLTPASGTESYQFREIEIVCGLRDDPIFQKYLAGTEKLPVRLLTPRQSERLRQPTLPEAFQQATQQRGIERYDEIFTLADVPNPHADLAELADTLLEFDQFFRFWRLGHVTMVEKMIGARSGTGFLGPEYLLETAGITVQEKNRVFEERQVRPRFFEELWAVRTRLGRY